MSSDPPDYELDDEEVAKAEEELDRLAEGAKRREIPPDIDELMWAIAQQNIIRMGEPDEPPYMFGRFEAFDSKIGGMGMVIEARDPQLDRKVAIKLWMAQGPEAERALVDEAVLLAKLRHPNVVTVHETGKWKDQVYFVMEWVEGRDGHVWMAEQRRGWSEVRDVFVSAGRGLAAAHDAGIQHRDFKPSNMLVGDRGLVLVADFGVAELVRSVDERVGELREQVGTPMYMAPERLRGHDGDARSDQFSFCVALWKALHGVRPFGGEEAKELLAAIDSGMIRGDRQGSEVPLWLIRVVLRGLEADPHDRFDDMHELVQALLDEPQMGGRGDGDVGDEESTKADERLLNSPRSLRRRWPWAVAGLAVGVAVTIGMFNAVSTAVADECEEVMSEVDLIWSDDVRAELRGAFGTRKAGDDLQEWVSRWVDVRAKECEAAKSEARDTGPTPCSASTRDRFHATIRAFRTPHLREGLGFAAVIAQLPDPMHCLDHPDDAEWGDGGLLELRNIDVEVEVLVGLGDLDAARTRQGHYMDLAREQRSEYGAARAIFWRGEIRRLEGQLDAAERDFEEAYEAAWSLGLAVFGAEVQVKLAAIAGGRGEMGVMDAHAVAAQAVFAEYRPERVAELLQVQGLALVAGPESTREGGVELLLRAVEQREEQLRDHGGPRERLSQAHESYARGLLAVHRAGEALEYFELALGVREDRVGHGTRRVRGILRQKFLCQLELGQLIEAEAVWRGILEFDLDDEDWRQAVEDALWVANGYVDAGQALHALVPLRMARTIAMEHGSSDDVSRLEHALDEILMGQ